MSLDSDAFCQVAGLVDIALFDERDVVGEPLQRHDGDERLNGFVGVGDGKEVGCQAFERGIAFGAHDDDFPFAGADFLDVGEGFGVEWAAGGDENGGGVFVDEGDRAVFHFGGGVSFRMNITNFFEFERAFERDGEVDIAPEVQHTFRGCEEGRGLFRPVFEGEGLLDCGGCLFDGFEQVEAVGEAEVAHAGEVEREQGENGDLRGEGLGARDADFGAGVEVDAAVGFARDGAADGVDDGEGGEPASFGFAECAQGVGGFAGLAEDEDQGAVV